MVQIHFEGLKVWQKGMELVRLVYRLSKNFPKDELYGITSQLRRAAVSIPANIAEGKGRNSTKELIQFLSIAKGSAYELSTLFKICEDQGYIDQTQSLDLTERCAELVAMINGLMNSHRG